MDGGIEFLSKFRMKNGGGLSLPEFETDSWDEVVKICETNQK